jgi:ABC-type glycerol-3-phosphate transport system substrate-binding protein
MVDLAFLRIPDHKLGQYFENLIPYIENDPDLSPDDFFPQVWSAMTETGALYSSVKQVHLTTLVTPPELKLETDSWTWDEFYRLSQDYQYPVNMYRERFMVDFYNVLYSDFIDWENGETHFDNEMFAQYLELAARLPTFPYNLTEIEKIANPETTLALTLLASDLNFFPMNTPEKLIEYCNTYTMRGFPTSSGGVTLNGAVNYMRAAIFSDCEHKDGAWQFVRMNFQNNSTDKRTAIRQENVLLDEWEYSRNILQTIVDEDGNGLGIPDEIFDTIEKMYAADIVFARLDARDGATAFTDNPAVEVVFNIIIEETAPYFAGQKTIDEVAKIVQSRASIYVAEQQ